MSQARQLAASPRAGVTFEVQRLELADGCLVISGHWSGVRGMRFVRPTLVVGGRRVLATLEHKPWSSAAGRLWTAAFPWEEDGDLDEELALTVAPTVSVILGARPAGADETQPLVFVGETAVAVAADQDDRADAAVTAAGAPPPPTRPPPEPASPARLLRLQDDLAQLTLQRNALDRRLEEAQALNADLDVRCRELEQAMRLERNTAQGAAEGREDVERARTAAERDRDRALARVDEAVHDREAALRTRARMEVQCDEAVQELDAAEARLARAIADRDEANAQRDEVLLAYRALQRKMMSERADADRGQAPGAGASGAGDDRQTSAEDHPDMPLGVRTMPAARAVMGALQRKQPHGKLLLSQFDLWVMRVLGTVAALCFISLLVMILRVFV